MGRRYRHPKQRGMGLFNTTYEQRQTRLAELIDEIDGKAPPQPETKKFSFWDLFKL